MLLGLAALLKAVIPALRRRLGRQRRELRLGGRQEPFRPHCELTRRFSLPAFPPGQRALIQSDPTRGLPLGNPHNRPAGNQALSQRGPGRQWIVGKESDDGGHEFHCRFRPIRFPIPQARYADIQFRGYLPLDQLQREAPAEKVVPDGFQLFRQSGFAVQPVCLGQDQRRASFGWLKR